jgi:hypothetical protein
MVTASDQAHSPTWLKDIDTFLNRTPQHSIPSQHFEAAYKVERRLSTESWNSGRPDPS